MLIFKRVPDICSGCESGYDHYGCAPMDLTREHVCPCSTCMLKMVCEDECDSFEKFSEILETQLDNTIAAIEFRHDDFIHTIDFNKDPAYFIPPRIPLYLRHRKFKIVRKIRHENYNFYEYKLY